MWQKYHYFAVSFELFNEKLLQKTVYLLFVYLFIYLSINLSLRNLKSLGDTVVVSLANTEVPGSSSSDRIARRLTRILEGAGVEWLGVNAKKHYIVVMGTGNGERFGVLAFCGVPKECIDNPNLAFYPVKYSQKTVKSAVEDLNQVNFYI